MRAAIYIRVSTEDQAQHGYSLAEQRSSCRERAKKLGAIEIIEFADEGISGGILERPGLAALREAARAGEIDIVIVRDPDRLSRKLAHQLIITEELDKYGVRLEFLDFEWKDSPEGRLFYSIRGAISEYEKEKIRLRMTRGKFQKAKQGGIPVNFDCYGYRYNPEKGQVEIFEDEAAIIRNIFNWFISEDIGINGVARRLNNMGVPTRRKRGKWHRQVVRQILLNPVYTGTWNYGKTDWHSGVRKSKEEWIKIEVPNIIDQSQWEAAQKKMEDARRLWAGKGKHEYLLSGIITCSDCGNTMTGVFVNWWGDRERRYTCRKSCQGAKNEGCYPMKAVPADAVEKAVWEQVCQWLQKPEALAREAANQIPRERELQKDLAKIEKHLADVMKGQERILEALAGGLLELDAMTREKLGELKRRKERLEKRKDELLNALQGFELIAAQIEEFQTIAQNVLTQLDELTFEEKKALVRALVAQVNISGRGIRGGNGLRTVNITVVAKIPEPEGYNLPVYSTRDW